jgi:hypothetical protein
MNAQVEVTFEIRRTLKAFEQFLFWLSLPVAGRAHDARRRDVSYAKLNHGYAIEGGR